MKHCFKKIDVDQVKFLFNEKNCRSGTFLFWKKEKFLLLVINWEYTNLNKNTATTNCILFEIIFHIHYII